MTFQVNQRPLFLREIHALALEQKYPKYFDPNLYIFLSYAYWGGGENANSSRYQSVERLQFSTDTQNSSNRNNLLAPYTRTASVNNNDFLYHSGGNSSGISNVIQRMSLASDTTNFVDRSDLVKAIESHAGAASMNFGWFMGGQSTSSNSGENTIQRFTIATDSINAIARSQLTQNVRESSTAQSPQFVWNIGGRIGNSNNRTDRVERFELSTDTVNAVQRNTLPVALRLLTSGQNTTFCLNGGGQQFNNANQSVNTITRMTFANDTATIVNRSSLTTNKARLNAKSNLTSVWWSGGFTSNSSTISTIERTQFANDTTDAEVRSNLNEIRQLHS